MDRDQSQLNYYERMIQLTLAKEKGSWTAGVSEALGSQSTKDIVAQLRQRSRTANRRTQWVFAALIGTIAVALSYYVGLPIWQQLQDANKLVYETQAQSLRTSQGEMDVQRNSKWEDLLDGLTLVASPLASPFDDPNQDIAATYSAESRKALVFFSQGSLIAETINAGQSWSQQYIPDIEGGGRRLLQSDETGNLLLFATPFQGQQPSSTGIFLDPKERFSLQEFYWPPYVSDNSGLSWRRLEADNVPSDVTYFGWTDDPSQHFLLANGVYYYSPDFGKSWVQSPSLRLEGTTFQDLTLRPDGSIVGVTDNGVIHRTVDADSDWVIVARLTRGEPIEDKLIDELTEYSLSIGWAGLTATLNSNGEAQMRWTADPSGTSWSIVDQANEFVVEPVVMVEPLSGPNGELAVGDYLLQFVQGGLIVSEDDAGNLTIIDRILDIGTFYTDVTATHEDTTIVFASSNDGNGTFVATFDGGASWQRIPVNGGALSEYREAEMLSIVTDGSAEFIFHYTSAGGAKFLQFNDQLRGTLDSIEPSGGGIGDTNLMDAARGLPSAVFSDLQIQKLLEDFRDSTSDRVRLDEELSRVEDRAIEIGGSGHSPAQLRQEYSEFVNSCGNAGVSGDKCSSTFLELQGLENDTIWEIFAGKAPQAVLLLFLLATLSNLYRYNLRISGFHASRADVLEILAIHSDNEGSPNISNLENIAKLADALGADKVEFGKSNNPTDQAVALTQAFLNRK